MSIYLDNAATTKIHPDVLKEMVTCLEETYANSEEKFYELAEKSKARIKEARRKVAMVVNAEEDEVVFTSGATESNNTFIFGYAKAHPLKKTIIISSIEHSSIIEPCLELEKNGYKIKYIPVNNTGEIDYDWLKNNIDNDTLFCSILMVNNEVGTIQNIDKINKICYEKNIVFHSDLTQAIGKIAIDWKQYSNLIAVTFTSHKIYGPKGIGALVLKRTDGFLPKISPIIYGGSQEYGIRAGTLSNELIIGFGKACELICENINESQEKLKLIEKNFIDILENIFSNRIKINNDFENRIYGLLNVQIIGFNNMIILKKLAPYIACSTGSACSVDKPSHVLKAMGFSKEEISYSIRFSFSKYQDVNEFEDLKKLY